MSYDHAEPQMGSAPLGRFLLVMQDSECDYTVSTNAIACQVQSVKGQM